MSVFGPRGYTPDDALLICAPAGLESAAGSALQLGDCGHLLIVAPSGQAQQKKTPEMRTLCTRCFATDHKLHEKLPFKKTGMLPGAEAELREALPKNADSERFIASVLENVKEIDYDG